MGRTRTYVIAEAGSCHEGQFDRAVELVRIAKQVGASAVKWQYWSDAGKLAEQRGAYGALRDAYENYAVPAAWLPQLSAIAREAGIGFLCTAYLPQDVAIVEPHVDHFKVASFEANYLPLLRAYGGLPAMPGRTLIVSLGMGQSAAEAMGLLKSVKGLPEVRFLHCVSGYPTPPEELNLGAIKGRDGFSDHCDPAAEIKSQVGALAVAAGASIVEAHLRLDATKRWCPDYPHSMNPAQFAFYVENIRLAEAAIGTGQVSVQASERASVNYVSKEASDGEAASEGDATGVR